jgi:hypothetical protein
MVLIENNSSSMANIKNFLPHKIFYILTLGHLVGVPSFLVINIILIVLVPWMEIVLLP